MASIPLGVDNVGMSRMRFGHWLKAQRAARRLSQADLEQRAGMGEKYVSRLENGKTTPGEDVRRRIHGVLGTTEDDLVNAGILTIVQVPGHDPVYVPATDDMGIVSLPVAVTDIGERAAVAAMLDDLPDEAVQHLRRFLEAMRDA